MWGSNYGGQLGDQITAEAEQSPVPVHVPLSEVTAISASLWDVCALRKDGTVWTWGANGHGYTSAVITKQSTPALVTHVKDVVAISSGGYHNTVLTKNGAVWAWTKHNGETKMAELIQLSGATQLSASINQTVVLKDDGAVWVYWKADEQIAEETNTYQEKKELKQVVSVYVGWFQSAAVCKDGTVWIWNEDELPKRMDGFRMVSNDY